MNQAMNQSIEASPDRQAADGCLVRFAFIAVIVLMAVIFLLGILAGVVIAAML